MKEFVEIDLHNQKVLKEKAKYLFFIGTDVTVPPYAIRQLIFHLEHHPKYAIAGGIYCHKSPPQEPLVYRGNGQGPYWDWKVGEVFDVDGGLVEESVRQVLGHGSDVLGEEGAQVRVGCDGGLEVGERDGLIPNWPFEDFAERGGQSVAVQFGRPV